MSEESGQLSAAIIFDISDERGKHPQINNSGAPTYWKSVLWRDVFDMRLSRHELTPWRKPMRIIRWLHLTAAALAFAQVMATPAQAEDGDTQLWNTQNFNYKFNDKWSVNLEVQERWYEDVSYFAFFVVRPSVTYKWNDWLSFTGGYAHFRVFDGEGDFADEDRIWEQVNIRLFGGKDQPTLNWRTRLEQRMFEAGGDTVWRLREQLRLMYPIVDRVQGVLDGGILAAERCRARQRTSFRRRHRTVAQLCRPQFRDHREFHIRGRLYERLHLAHFGQHRRPRSLAHLDF